MSPIIKRLRDLALVIIVSCMAVLFGQSAYASSGTLGPRGVIDNPAAGSTLQGTVTVRGWFLDGTGVSKVEVLVDGKVIGNATYGLSRPDVYKAYSQYKNNQSGYQYSLNTAQLASGTHRLSIRETGKNGVQTTISRTVVVKNLSVQGRMDSPGAGSTLQGTASVRGWFLNGSGVSRIEVLVDGKVIGNATYGLSRPDVYRAYPQYQNSHSGYQYSLNTTQLANGTHQLSVRETGGNGVQTTISRTVNVHNFSVQGRMDSPGAGSTLQGTAAVRGWFLNGGGVSRIEVLVDGKVIGNATYGLSRPDVYKAYPQYQNSHSGYQYSLNTTQLANGTHQLSVRETGKNGVQTTISRTVTVKNLLIQGRIDSPAAGSTLQGTAAVRGWFLDGAGVSKIEVLVDGKVIGNAAYGLSRPDVYKAYPQYKNSQSGYQYNLNTTQLTNGSHQLSVRETSVNGRQTTINRTVTVKNLPAQGRMDNPAQNGVIQGSSYSVQGWFLDVSGVSKIEVLVDGKAVGNAAYGQSRPDVYKVYPQYKNSHSGYQFSLDTTQFSDGNHTLSVKETGGSGAAVELTRNVNIKNYPYEQVDLKKPADITKQDILNFLNASSPNSPLAADAQSFIDAQDRYGVNAQYLLAQAIWETGWGTSDLYKYKHNLYGYGAFDIAPFTCGYYFPTDADSINYAASQIRSNYLNAGGSYYSAAYGPTLIGMNQYYATDPNWKNGIASIMAEIKSYDASYYQKTAEISSSAADTTVYGTDIPAGKPVPSDIVINYSSGTVGTVVNTSFVNMRSLPYVADSTYITSIAQGTQVNVLGYNTDVRYDPGGSDNYAYRWYRVSVNGRTGWIYGQYLTVGK
ncbi:Ig-like domain-containing protein [Sporolactobacillus sp. CQH2019]|uniref:Ig-like domain-containing protein n=1 Tax=Sporolactobacillus sp. CQH2019 TaxID=3023512 RepID=UPI002367AC13|nr:Ig-like domain-containing protein [Sporolactobacillus sp. CQH2019]MDD9148211.1 Ig-like domain-containing protein [Sporolactobacillus sp. CQH2019]